MNQDQLVDELRNHALWSAQNYGGYPAEVFVLAGHIVVAGTVDQGNEPDVDVYTPEDVAEWVREYEEMRGHPDSDEDFLLWESCPGSSFVYV